MVARRKKRTRKLQTVCSTVVRMEEVVSIIISRRYQKLESNKYLSINIIFKIGTKYYS